MGSAVTGEPAPRPPRTITIDLDDAIIVRNVFLPRNPNKMRGADPLVVAAAKKFIREVNAAVDAAINAGARTG